MIYRYSTRRKKLDQSFLNKKLKGAISYDRIAGYFSSSILEVAGEAIEEMQGYVRVVCNSEMQIDDARTASAAVNAMRREWCSIKPEEIYSNASDRLKKLYTLLKSEKLKIKVIPNDVFGLIHGKAGVITLKDGSKTSFIGSVNETYAAWKLNYEILWEDDSQEAVDWVQEEFDYFWNSPYAIPISDFVIEDIKRISERKVIYTVDEWKQTSEPASTVVESPVYRQEYGLWEHQKFFVNLAFNDHKKTYGARYVLADMVGLGKTIQLALSAQLMALYGDKPILIIVPKTLLWQWQDEMNNLLDMPSAVWTGKEWVDENGIKYPSSGDTAIKKCPRRVGIISQGLITANSETIQPLLNMEYECIIVDEAHRARRKNLVPGKEHEKPQPNNLMKFLLEISKRTKSMLLATATPVQLYPIEAWDLLNILSQANDSVLGSNFSMWRRYPERALNLIMEKESIERFSPENWDWVRNPFPPASEGETTFGRIREQLYITDEDFVIKPEAIHELRGPDQRRIGRIIDDNFITEHNPFIRHIVRRTRDFLENTETGEPYLKAVKVRLFGETDNEAIVLPPYLQEAYGHAEEFCELLQKRVKGGGFLKTLLLKRVGSTMIAGKNTAEKMLYSWGGTLEDEEYEEDDRPAEILKQKQLVYDIVDKRLDLTYEQRDMFYFKFEGGDFSEWYGHEEYKQFQDNYYKVRNKIKDEIQKDKIKKTTMSVLRSVENEVRAIKDKKRLEIIKKQQDQGYFKTISTYTNLNDMDNKKEPDTVIISKKDLKELISEMIPTANKTETNIEVQSQKLINTEVLKALVFDVIKKELLSELSNLAIQTASEGLINKPSAIIMKNRLDTSEALKYLSERGFSISRSTLSKYSNNGTIVSTLKSNRRYFTTEDLDVFLKKMAA